MARPSYLSVQHSRTPFRKMRPQKRRRKSRFAFWLFLAAGGGFAGTLAALQFVPGQQAGATGVPIRVQTTPVAAPDQHAARFGFCHSGGGRNCVVDGDTFRFAGETYRIADIDTPETHPARCAGEAMLGEAATERLRDLLSDGAFSLDEADRDTDIHGRKLRIVTRGGQSVGEQLVAEGLARRWEGRRRPWC
jgi:endonuclease YncB( thermonuclease family)